MQKSFKFPSDFTLNPEMVRLSECHSVKVRFSTKNNKIQDKINFNIFARLPGFYKPP